MSGRFPKELESWLADVSVQPKAVAVAVKTRRARKPVKTGYVREKIRMWKLSKSQQPKAVRPTRRVSTKSMTRDEKILALVAALLKS